MRPINRACISQFFLPLIPSVPAPDHGTSLLILPLLSVFHQVCEEKIIAASICLWAEKSLTYYVVWEENNIQEKKKKNHKRKGGHIKRSKMLFLLSSLLSRRTCDSQALYPEAAF